MSKTSLKERNKAIRLAWEREQKLVTEGKGTRDWSEDQQKDILDPNKGKAYDENGRAFEGQHMKSAAEYPDYQGDPDNIQFLTREEHLEAHKGSWQNPTNWYYNPETKEFVDFGENKPTSCEIIKLSDPVAVQTAPSPAEQDDVESAKERQASSETSDKPDSVPTKNETRTKYSSHSTRAKPSINGTQGSGVRKVVDTITSSVEKAAKWAWNHKGEIIAGAVTLGKIGLDIADTVSKSNSGNSGKGGFQPIFDTFSDITESEEGSSSSNDDVTVGDHDDSEKGTHASPREHMVKPHGQHYGKDKVGKEKAAYPRGGKNKENE